MIITINYESIYMLNHAQSFRHTFGGMDPTAKIEGELKGV